MRSDFHPNSSSSTPSARVLANQANATKSTGPVTNLGKTTSSLNAVKTGLTGRTVLLSSDDAEQYRQHLAQWQGELQPVGPRECSLVQSIADAHWRTDRITRLEFALWAQGHANFADQFASEPNVELRRGLIEMETMLHFEKQLRNLRLQESRIRRAREKDMKELKDLQAKRRAEAEETAYKAAMAGRHKQGLSTAGTNGFVFAKTVAAPNGPSNTNVSAAEQHSASAVMDQKTAA